MKVERERESMETELEYQMDMSKLISTSTLLSSSLGEDGRYSIVLVSTIFHPQGGGQPSDTGYITLASCPSFKFIVTDARSKDGIVFHYGSIENSNEELELMLRKGVDVILYVDEPRRKLNSRLHSAGHLLDVCLEKVGLGYLEPSKAYHFPVGPYVEYRGTVPQSEWQSKSKALEIEANNLICRGCKVSAATLSYDKACELCGGSLPDYIPKESSPRIVKLGDYPGCPCGGTHVPDVTEIVSMKVSQMRTKKGMTKVFYNVAS